MDNTLSQEEVDALLQAVNSGAVETEDKCAARMDRKVVPYSFRKSKPAAQDHIRSFVAVHEEFAAKIRYRAPVDLKTALDLKLVSCEGRMAGDFLDDLPRPAFLSVVAIGPRQAMSTVCLGLPVAAALINILLGGDAAEVDEPREPTAMEMSVGETITDFMVAQLRAAWRLSGDIRVEVVSHHTDPASLRVFAPATRVLEATFDVRLGTVAAIMTVAYPYDAIQPLLDAMSPRAATEERTAQAAPTDPSNVALSGLASVPIDLRAVIGYGVLSAGQLWALKPGQVICLDRHRDAQADVYIDDRLCFRAQWGRRRGRGAVRLQERCPPE